MSDILGKALLDYQSGRYTEDIATYSSLDEEDSIPLPYLFRGFHKMPLLEQKALELCKGSVLDIGCGAGSHSLYLQEKGHAVTALDFSKGAIAVCKDRGVLQTEHCNIYDYCGTKFDTLLMLMNGIGIVGKLNGLNGFFAHLKSLLRPEGQILVDSSDIIYMYEQDDDGGYWIPSTNGYYGEVEFVMEYKGEKGSSFSWLYVDFATLKQAALVNGLDCELVYKGEHYDYLAKLNLMPQ